jgi:hypothetical protein
MALLLRLVLAISATLFLLYALLSRTCAILR